MVFSFGFWFGQVEILLGVLLKSSLRETTAVTVCFVCIVCLLWTTATRGAVQRAGTGAAAQEHSSGNSSSSSTAAAAAIRVLQQGSREQGEAGDHSYGAVVFTNPTYYEGEEEGAGAGRPSTTTTQAPHRERGSLGHSELPPAARGATNGTAAATYCSTSAGQTGASEPSENF